MRPIILRMSAITIDRQNYRHLLDTALYCCYRDFEFVSQSTDLSQFNRSDGQIINYFSPIKDRNDKDPVNEQLSTLDQWLTKFKNLKNKGLISANDIHIIPMVNVDTNNHINTLVITADDNHHLQAYLIEPREIQQSSDFFKRNHQAKKVMFQLEKNLAKVFPEHKIKVNPLTLRLQNNFEFTSGSHHINVVEMTAHLSRTAILHARDYLYYLRSTDLSSRADDQSKAAFMADHLQHSRADYSQLLQKVSLKLSTHREISTKNTISETLNFLLNLLKNDPLDPQQKLYKVGIILLSAYKTIKDTAFHECVGEALSSLLGCEAEYKHVQPEAANLFKHRLRLMQLSLRHPIPNENINSAIDAMSKISELDNQYANRIGFFESAAVEKKKLFSQIVSKLNLTM